jgi:DNA mismatch repair protein MLH1
MSMLQSHVSHYDRDKLHCTHFLEASSQKKIYSQNKVRTSIQDRTIDSMIPIINPTHATANESDEPSRIKDIKESDCVLSSIRNLRADVARGRHGGTRID